ncbi:uncharacterized protein EI97DRAFT_366554 [Westerdykella ornata]|uniref:Arrestin C-terminal-like domain-containing protein n=1 Tax=Westerdykella ornata TaxID=318751 RepID=A0A6A6K0Q5_WESOR|nr:uncharacterized protein EI97DRAFT_366554 [Westerdykella ornata]KAF2280919.1 hypothetical protein EI97DRAFT_366554 [Westerdykella ornata]
MTSSSTRTPSTVVSSPSASSPLSLASSGRSLLARLRSPLQSKTRHFADFYILPDDPHRQYAPGDVISGSVILKVVKPLRITHLVISLHGYAQVFKNPNAPGDAYRAYSSTIGSGKGRKGGGYFGNGFASLFEDEVVLCGEGRLAEGVYHFNFELEFPCKGLPSSIDFERGTISYMLTATLTRPTTMSPTASCDTKVYLQETVDIASTPEPKPQVISLEPISKRARAKSAARKRTIVRTRSSASTQPGTKSEAGDSSRTARASEFTLGTEQVKAPRSPAPSDTSFESQMSSGNASGTDYGIRSINTTVGGSAAEVDRLASKDRTITAAIKVGKGGFLRGDQIPIKILVQHTKHVRSLRGIIVTLYRQARVDMHPALPVLPNSKGDKLKSEDYYPKSRTGLGGLSLSSAGSSHLFRKDLSQSFAPLFVDPRTLTAEIKCAVRVPEEAFPTISNVPGAMISFKYFVEVVVDIQGKLTRLDRLLPNAGLVNVPSAAGLGTASEDGTGSMFSTWGGTFVDTEGLRREKGVIHSVFEVVIGTKDSERNGRRKQPATTNNAPQESDANIEGDVNDQAAVHDVSLQTQEDPYGYPDYQCGYGDESYGDYGYGATYSGLTYHDSTPAYYGPQNGHHPPPPLPPVAAPAAAADEEGLSEKERIRRAEARLLPSQPPDLAGPSAPAESSSHPHLHEHPRPAVLLPSAPVLPEDGDDNANASGRLPPFPRGGVSSSMRRRGTGEEGVSTRNTGACSLATVTPVATTPHLPYPPRVAEEGVGADMPTPLPSQEANHPILTSQPPNPSSSAPEYFPSESSVGPHVYSRPTDDKQELQRRRLQLETSAPPDDDEDVGDSAGPSAPSVEGVRDLAIRPCAPNAQRDGEGPRAESRQHGERHEGSNSGNRDSQEEALPAYRR